MLLEVLYVSLEIEDKQINARSFTFEVVLKNVLNLKTFFELMTPIILCNVS